MKVNQIGWERGLRVALGAGLVSMAFVGPRTPWGWLGAILVGTGLVGYCPVYGVLGLSTRERKVS